MTLRQNNNNTNEIMRDKILKGKKARKYDCNEDVFVQHMRNFIKRKKIGGQCVSTVLPEGTIHIKMRDSRQMAHVPIKR